MKVVIAGAGIGGLACAQGLVRAGFDVTVVERDAALAGGGYRLHLSPPVVDALRRLLAPAVFEELLANAIGSSGFSLSLRDHRGRLLKRIGGDPSQLSLEVDRATLRRVLATGLADRLRLGRRCRTWRVDGETVLVDVEGTTLDADVFVIADGAGSLLAERMAGHRTSTPCGLTGIAGTTPTARLSASARALLGDTSMLAIGAGGTGLFATVHDVARLAAIRRAPGSESATPDDAVVVWGLIATDTSLPASTRTAARQDLVTTTAATLRANRWTSTLVQVVEAADRSTVSAYRFDAADPDHVAPWPTSRITALGDAVHAMPPTGGQGAGTAVLDADDLVQALVDAARGETTTLVAVHDYERQLRQRGAQAVRESLQPVQWIRAAATPVGGLAWRALAPLRAATSGAVAARGERR